MGVRYQAVSWNRQKRIYDLVMIGLMGVFLLVFVFLNLRFYPESTLQTMIIRAFGSLALVMLHVVLVIGPLCRLDARFLPLLYNRRHLGVSMFVMAAVHGVFSIIQFHALGNINPIASLFLSNAHYDSVSRFPFQVLGFIALFVLFLMAASSHDFWLKNLGPRFWKGMHMLVYVAYGLIVMHVMLGVVQLEKAPLPVMLMGLGFVAVAGVHLWAGFWQRKNDMQKHHLVDSGYYQICEWDEIEAGRAKIVHIDGENIAIFKHDEQLSAVSNICKHQNGPLGEGRIVNGCIVCPWHGYEYRPEDGCSPPPFTEKVSTYQIRLQGNTVWLNPKPEPEGTYLRPVKK